jgi:hypothetical protein
LAQDGIEVVATYAHDDAVAGATAEEACEERLSIGCPSSDPTALVQPATEAPAWRARRVESAVRGDEVLLLAYFPGK